MSKTFGQRSFFGGVLSAALALAIVGCGSQSVYQQTIEPPDEEEPAEELTDGELADDVIVAPEPDAEATGGEVESEFDVPPNIEGDAPAERQVDQEPSFSLPPDLNEGEN